MFFFFFRVCVYVMRAHCPTGRDARSQGFAGSAPAGGWELWNCAVVLHGLCHGPKSKGRMRSGPIT